MLYFSNTERFYAKEKNRLPARKGKDMNYFESNVQYIKYLVNKEVAYRFFQGTLEKGPFQERDIAEAIIPGPKASFRCCIYNERKIIEDRVHLILEPTKNNRVINVLDSACDECPLDRFVVSDSCRGCLGHKCQEVPKKYLTSTHCPLVCHGTE